MFFIINNQDINMKLPKTSTLVAIGAITLGLAAAGAGVSYAASATISEQGNPMSSLVTAIAQKFNLNTADVQQVFDEQRAQMQVQRQQMFSDRLAQAVTDGKLTQDQADKITAKMTELQAQREADKSTFDSLTQAERQTKMQEQMTALKQWATDNNIPTEFMLLGHGPSGHGMKHGMGMMEDKAGK